MRAAFGGTLATQFDTDNGTKYVQVLYPLADQTSLKTLDSITLRSATGKIVHLGDIAVLQNAPAQALITRVNRQTVIHIGSNVERGYTLSNVQNDFLARVKALHLPNTVHRRRRRRRQPAEPAPHRAGFGLVAHPVGAARLSADGRALRRLPRPAGDHVRDSGRRDRRVRRLALTHQGLNLFSIIGVVMLVGLVSKNGILLVDFAGQARTCGHR